MFDFTNTSNGRKNLYLVICFLVLGICSYGIYDVYKDIQYKKDHPEKKVVQVKKRYHFKTTGIETLPGSDSHTFIGRAIVDPEPVITTMKEGEEIDQEENWQLLEDASSKYFSNYQKNK